MGQTSESPPPHPRMYQSLLKKNPRKTFSYNPKPPILLTLVMIITKVPHLCVSFHLLSTCKGNDNGNYVVLMHSHIEKDVHQVLFLLLFMGTFCDLIFWEHHGTFPI